MPFKDRVKNVLKNLPRIVEIKLEDCKVYDEYSVIVLYDEDSDIISCNSSDEANAVYNYLTEKFNNFKSQKNNQSMEK